ncbi:major facilitator superfamily domain-containing protein [Xylaria bambusicola]|uniref:major facilitator superfamily domain-containing protein n=1 Tax=Xylaria bambusicola TaxID=326684 RepID=UPI00200784C3|nr:major facilitator superfamily domain-containing protein [Xylaria bambusicola]KAI0516757.1 major facilitator superfamily domain-containing protein [Xylaria bambusicola]
MATATSTTTAIELGPLTTVLQREPIEAPKSDSSSTVDPVLEASRLADSDVPDGGYGWVVVASCAVLSWWTIGTSYSWGVIQGYLVEDGLSTPAVLSFVGALGPTLLAAVAILNSRIMRMIGVRYTGMLGIFLIGLAEILAGFAVNSVPGLFITEGVLLGLGFGLTFIVTSTGSAQYFSKKRGLANGVVFAGGGFGGAVLSLALDPLIRAAGPAWAFRTLGLSTIATGLPAAWFIKERTPIRNGGFVEWRLFKNPSFVFVFIGGAIGTFPLLVPPFFIPLFANAIGLSSATGAGLLAGFNFASAVGRILSGLLCDKIGPLNALFLALSLAAISMLAVWPVSTSLAPLAVFSVVNGMANGGFFSTMPTVVGNCFGSARVTVAMGMIVTSWSGGYLLGAPIAGYLLDAYGGQGAGFQAYRPAMFYAGSLALGAAGFIELVRFRTNRNFFAKV